MSPPAVGTAQAGDSRDLAAGLGDMNGMLPVSRAPSVDLGREHSGVVSGAMNTAGQLGSFLSSIAFGYMVQRFGSYDRAILPLAFMLLVSGLPFVLINPAASTDSARGR